MAYSIRRQYYTNTGFVLAVGKAYAGNCLSISSVICCF